VRDQLLLSGDLEDVGESVERLFRHRSLARQLNVAEIGMITKYLCPDADLIHDQHAYASRARERLDSISATQMETLRPLDRHRRVVVSGKAGTGKTFLAKKWALRGVVDHDDGRPRRALLTCYNEPLAAQLTATIPESDDLVVGAFLTTALAFEGMPALERGETEDHRWWMAEVVPHLLQNWHRITERFDRIIVDEAQDFSPAWLGLLEALLDPDGDNKLFLFVDSSQTVYERGFVMPRIEDGWVHAELSSNVRNTRDIAQLARRVTDGAPAPLSRPESSMITGMEADSAQSAYVAAYRELTRLADEGIEPSDILVVTTTSAMRDHLRSNLALVPWELREGGAIACETAYRAKGLEASAVIVVEISELPDPTHLYVGITRAINQLTVIGPAGLLEKLGLA
jgi:superfamily I DNA/RNA helicase